MCRAGTIANRRVSRASFSFLRSWGGNSQTVLLQGAKNICLLGRASVANARPMTSLRPSSHFFCLAARRALSSLIRHKVVVRWLNRQGTDQTKQVSPESNTASDPPSPTHPPASMTRLISALTTAGLALIAASCCCTSDSKPAKLRPLPQFQEIQAEAPMEPEIRPSK